jgi:hypothetical protein
MSKVVIAHGFDVNCIHQFSQGSGTHYLGDGFVVWGISEDLGIYSLVQRQIGKGQ